MEAISFVERLRKQPIKSPHDKSRPGSPVAPISLRVGRNEAAVEQLYADSSAMIFKINYLTCTSYRVTWRLHTSEEAPFFALSESHPESAATTGSLVILGGTLPV